VIQKATFIESTAREREEGATDGPSMYPLNVAAIGSSLQERVSRILNVLGYLIGDDNLFTITRELGCEVRGQDEQVARIGGQEIALILPNGTLEMKDQGAKPSSDCQKGSGTTCY
jgi:hypothetical protein